MRRADDTVAIDSLSRLPGTAAAISWELRNQYVLGYKPKAVEADGQWRKIKVKVSPQGDKPLTDVSHLQAYYKKGYLTSGR